MFSDHYSTDDATQRSRPSLAIVPSFERASVIIPTYNRAATLKRAIDSVLAAVIPGDEVIVVDDGSTDNTPLVVAPYDGRIRYIRMANGGAGRARNRGVREARCPLVAFLDSDDEWMPDRLALGRALLAARPEVLFCFSEFGLRQAGLPDQLGGLAGWHRDPRPWDEILGPGVPYTRLVGAPSDRADFQVHVGDLYPRLLEASYLAVQTLLVRRERAGPALHFAEDVPTYEDWECAARIARVGPAAYLACATAWQWGHGGPRLTDAGVLERATARITIIERVWSMDPSFQSGNAARVRSVLEAQYLIKAKALIALGRTEEARQAIRSTGEVPLAYRAAAALPGSVAGKLMALRSLLLRGSRRFAWIGAERKNCVEAEIKRGA